MARLYDPAKRAATTARLRVTTSAGNCERGTKRAMRAPGFMR
jgi:hypothetical protein